MCPDVGRVYVKDHCINPGPMGPPPSSHLNFLPILPTGFPC